MKKNLAKVRAKIDKKLTEVTKRGGSGKTDKLIRNLKKGKDKDKPS